MPAVCSLYARVSSIYDDPRAPSCFSGAPDVVCSIDKSRGRKLRVVCLSDTHGKHHALRHTIPGKCHARSASRVPVVDIVHARARRGQLSGAIVHVPLDQESFHRRCSLVGEVAPCALELSELVGKGRGNPPAFSRDTHSLRFTFILHLQYENNVFVRCTTHCYPFAFAPM